MKTPRIGIVVVTYNSGSFLGQFLESIPGATRFDVDVVVSDNGSTDASLDLVRCHHPDVTILETGANLGYGGAMNAGAALLPDADWLLIANPDVILSAGSIDRLVEAALANPGAGAVGPRILQPDGTPYPSARRLPTLFTGFGHALLATLAPQNPWSLRYRSESLLTETRTVPVGWLSGACLLVSGELFRRMDGFDDRYFMYFEDVDLGRRIGLAGRENLFVPTSTVTHVGAHSTREQSARMLRVHHRSAYIYLSSVYSGFRWLPVRLALRAGLSIRSRLLSRRIGQHSG